MQVVQYYQDEIYEDVQESDMPSGDKKEKKEQLRSKVQALVSYYEEEKRRNEKLEMENERLKAQLQNAGIAPQQPSPNGPAPFGAAPPQSQPSFGPPPSGAPQPPSFGQQPPGFGPPPGAAPQPPSFGQPPAFGSPPGAPPQPPFGPPPGFQQPGYGPADFNQPPRPPQGFPPPSGAPQAPGFGAPPQGFGQQQPQMGQPYGDPTASIAQVLQTIEQLRQRLQAARGPYGYQQPPTDYETVQLLDKLYDQLGSLTRELSAQQRGRY